MPEPRKSKAGHPIRERILLFGDSDAGKTWWLLKIAEWHQRRGSDAHFYGLCTPGNSWDVFFLPSAEFEDLDNVTFFEVTDAQDYFDIYDNKVKRQARPQDWLSVDVLGDLRASTIDEGVKRDNRGRDLGSAWATTGGDYPVSGWDGWGPVNARYAAFTQNRLLPFPGHVLCMAWERDLAEPSKSSGRGGDSAEVRDLFGPIGAKPMGEKNDYKRFRTIIHLGKNGRGEHVARTARDKQRTRLGELVEIGKVTQFRGHKISNPYTDYLMKIGGWRP